MSDHVNWQLLTRVFGEPPAHVLESFLQSNGILVRLKLDPLATVYGLSSGPLGEVKVFVPEEQLALAKQLLDESSLPTEHAEEI